MSAFGTLKSPFPSLKSIFSGGSAATSSSVREFAEDAEEDGIAKAKSARKKNIPKLDG